MKMSAEEYGRRVRRVGPPSPLGGDCLWAFGVGGSICLLGEVLTAEREEAEAAKQEEADRKAREKEEAQAEKLRLKEEEAERKRKQKLEDEARRKAERRAAKIESQLISAGGQVLKRGLLGVLKKW